LWLGSSPVATRTDESEARTWGRNEGL